MLANLASVSLMVPILLAVAREVVPTVWIELAAAGGVLLAGGALGFHRGDDDEVPAPTAESRMFRFRHAVLFAAVITAVLFASTVMGAWLGPRGAIGAAVLAAAAELHAATATLGNLAGSGRIDLAQTRWALLGLLAASMIAKTLVAFTAGGARFGLRVGAGLFVAVGAAAAVVVLGAGPLR